VSTAGPWLRHYCYERSDAGERYYICGGWGGWNFEPMDGGGGVFGKTVPLDGDRCEFQIVLERDWGQSLCPAAAKGGADNQSCLQYDDGGGSGVWSFRCGGASGCAMHLELRKGPRARPTLRAWCVATEPGDVSPVSSDGVSVAVTTRPQQLPPPSARFLQCSSPHCTYLMHTSDGRYRMRGLCCGGCPEGAWNHGERCSRMVAPPGTRRAPSTWYQQRACSTPYCTFRIHTSPFDSRWPTEDSGGSLFHWYCCLECGESFGERHGPACERQAVRPTRR